MFNNLTTGQISYLAELFSKFIREKIVHKNHADCFFVEAAELQTVFGHEYKEIISKYLICKDEQYKIGEGKYTKAYKFNEEILKAFSSLKAHSIKIAIRSTMDVTYEEKINVNALNDIIQNADIKEETRLQLILLRAQTSETGINVVWYRRTGGSKGRRFAGCVSLQGVPSEIRAKIIDGAYTDLDMANAHPTLLSAFANKLGLNADSINFYIENREKVLGQIMKFWGVDRKAAKNLMLQLSYGASLSYSRKLRAGELNAFTTWCDESGAVMKFDESGTAIIPTYLQNFKSEMSNIGKTLMAQDDAMWIDDAKRKYVARGCALYLQHIEDECLAVIERWCKYKGINVMTLCFDGLILEGEGHNFDEAEMFVNIMLQDTYGIDANLKLVVKK